MLKKDYAQAAHSVFKQSIGAQPKTKPVAKKNLAAVELGSRGGKARAKNLTKAQRSAQARKAAKARWGKR